MNLRTLRNWEQGRTRPTGPARALLGIVEKNPKTTRDPEVIARVTAFVAS